MERNDKLIKSKFYKYLLPGIMMVAAMQLGNLVDSIFVGNFLGSDALSAINLGMPVVQISQIPILIMAVGGSIVSGICLGKRDMKKASAIYTAAMISVLLINIVNAVSACFYCRPLADILSGGGSLMAMTCDFMWFYLIGMPFVGISLMISYFMSVDNHPFESAALHIVANVINLVADYVFILIFSMGIKASALSTVAGYSISGIIFGIVYLKSPKRTLKLIPKEAFKDSQLIKDAVKNGLSSGMIIVLGAVKMMILNAAILVTTGDTGMALYAVCVNSSFLIQLCLHGVSGVIQTVAGVLYGEKDYFGIRVVLKHVLKLCLMISALLTALFIAAPGMIEGMFGFDIPEQTRLMDLCLRVYALSFIGYALNNIMQTYYSTIEKPFYATLNTVLQGLVILVPVTLALLPATGVVGTSIGAVVAETGAFIIVTVVRIVMQKKGTAEGSKFDMLPEKQNERFVDVTVKGNIHDAAGIAHKLREYCEREGINARSANIVAVAGEELVNNIACYGDKKRSYIDVCLVKEEEKLVLRVRDDGPFFNPLEYGSGKEAETDDDIEGLSGIKIIKSLADRLDYLRVLNMNNTIVEISARIGDER